MGKRNRGHQIEGLNTNSQNWFFEQEARKKNPAHEVSGMACDHYRRYKEDADLLEELGHKAYRMSVEWSRIQPEEDKFDEAALSHYLNELSYLKEKGVRLFVTLVHFTVPYWFHRLGGFEKLENMRIFEKYLDYIVPRLSPYADFWCVMNEFNLGLESERATYKLNCIRYHALGYHIIKKYSDKPVSAAHALVQYMPLRPFDEKDRLMTHYCDLLNNEFFFHAMRTGEIVYPFRDAVYDKSVKDTVDFWAINCYTRDMIDARKAGAKGERYSHKELKMLPMKFYLEEMYPEGMLANMTRLMDKPVYITENGCSCTDDRFRIVYIALYLSALNEAIRLGADVRGYLYWSTMDNYEWNSFVPRFGLVDVDFETFERTPKPSAYFYKEIIERNGFSQDVLRRYLRELPTL